MPEYSQEQLIRYAVEDKDGALRFVCFEMDAGICNCIKNAVCSYIIGNRISQIDMDALNFALSNGYEKYYRAIEEIINLEMGK